MRAMSRLIFLFIFVITAGAASSAAVVWYNPQSAGYDVVQNQGWPDELRGTYQRLPRRVKDDVGKMVWNHSLNSSGLAVEFTTDAPSITVRYKVDGQLAMPHMPATSVSGVDLYRLSSDSTAGFCFGNYSFGDTVTYNYAYLHPSLSRYRLNLPLYNSISGLEIGVPEGSSFVFEPRSEERPIVAYGTSITHGACVSRPGMAWTNILGRQLGMPVYNIGFSGNGLLAPAVISLIGEIDAAAYVLDCLPNLINRREGEVYGLVIDAVRSLRRVSSAPIVLVDHCGYSNAATNTGQRERYEKPNREQRRAYNDLQAEGVPNLYYVTHDQLDYPADAWVDYIHPSDLGAQRHADELTHRLKGILDRK